MINSISISDLKSKINSINLIDIRNKIRYNSGHISGAKNIEKDDLLKNPNKYLNKQDTYYIYCERGITSYNVTIALTNLGYNVINIEGGYSRWILMN